MVPKSLRIFMVIFKRRGTGRSPVGWGSWRGMASPSSTRIASFGALKLHGVAVMALMSSARHLSAIGLLKILRVLITLPSVVATLYELDPLW